MELENLTWHKGPPPHPGWWLASTTRNKRLWRWWSGIGWSRAFLDSEAVTTLDLSEFGGLSSCDYIEWSDYYPEDARVERVDPNA